MKQPASKPVAREGITNAINTQPIKFYSRVVTANLYVTSHCLRLCVYVWTLYRVKDGQSRCRIYCRRILNVAT